MTQRLNGNAVTLTSASKFRKKSVVLAFQLADNVTFQKSWGRQDCTLGYYVLVNVPSGDANGCEPEVFARTYEKVSGTNNIYRKTAYIRALRMEEEFEVTSKDSSQPEVGHRGDYLVQNGEDANDRYLIEAAKFDSLYELAE